MKDKRYEIANFDPMPTRLQRGLGCAAIGLTSLLIGTGAVVLIENTTYDKNFAAHYSTFNKNENPIREGTIDATSKQALRSQIWEEVPITTQRQFPGQRTEIIDSYYKILKELNPSIQQALAEGHVFEGRFRDLNDDYKLGR